MAIVVAIIVVVALIIYGMSLATTEKITITGLNVQVQYNGSDQGYFGPTSQSVAISNQPNQVLEINKGQQFYLSVPFAASALASGSHSINQITVTTQGFAIISIDPSLPITLSPADSIRITITFQSPNSYFTGAVNLVFSTT